MKKEKIKTEQRCISHSCNKCGRKLREEMTWGERIFLAIIIAIPLLLVTFLDRVNPKYTDCFTRDYISGRGTDHEVVKTVDIDCPR